MSEPEQAGSGRSPKSEVPRVERSALLAELSRLGLLTTRVEEGLALADQTHAAQRRYGGGPYLEEHIYPVTQETARFLAAHPMEHGRAEDAVLTALLHDAIEDSAWVSRGLLRERFGANVARWVTALTKPSKVADLPDDEPAYVASIRAEGQPAVTIKVFDRLNNLAGLHLRALAAREPYLRESRAYYLPLAELVDPALVDQMAYLIAHQESRLLGEDGGATA